VKPLREAVRAIVADPDGRVVLMRYASTPPVWATPGGGAEPDESDEEVIRRELAEELGLDEFELGPCVWVREHEFEMQNHRGQRERIHLVRVEAFEPAPRVDLAAEWVTEVRWWTVEEIEASDEIFSPRRLGRLLRELFENGPASEPLDVGV
jgi:ADP-ribose pyrophosphatase YjhB (NUDIX family)